MNHETRDVTGHCHDFDMLAVSAQREHLMVDHKLSTVGALGWDSLGNYHFRLHEGRLRSVQSVEERAQEIRRKRAEAACDEVRDYIRQQLYAAFRDNCGSVEGDPGAHYVVTEDGTLVKITVELA